MRPLLTFLVCASASLRLHAAVVALDTNAIALAEPTSAAWSAVVNFRPGSNAQVTVNPPRFSWTYVPQATNSATDIRFYYYRFQCSTNSNFSTTDVDVQTALNFYNFLAPFTNFPVYWRVAYMTNGVTNVFTATAPELALGTQEWSAVRSFTLASSYMNWDRSMFADTNYLATNAAHPYIMFKAATRGALYTNLLTNALADWSLLNYYATNAITLAGWPTNVPTSLANDYSAWADRVGYVALMWQLQKHTTVGTAISNSLPGVALASLATNFLALGGSNADMVAGYGYSHIPALALGYDWLHDLLTLQQKTQVLAALDARCGYIVNHSGTFAGWNAVSGFQGCGGPSHNKAGFSHDLANLNGSVLAALSSYADGPAFGFTNGLKLFNTAMNYMMGVTYCYGFEGGLNQGRTYSSEAQFGSGHDMTLRHLQFGASFPAAQLHLNPWWQTTALWWDWMVPVALTDGHEPWGEGKASMGRAFSWADNTYFRDLSWMARSKRMYDHYRNELATYVELGGSGLEVQEYHYSRVPLLAYFTNPPTNNVPTNTAAIFPEDGWAFGGTLAPHKRELFTNGVYFVFGARPRGSELGHSGQSDLSFQITAYGAAVTDAGVLGLTEYAHVPQSQYTLLVNGVGPAQPYTTAIEDYCARFEAFTNGSTFTYARANGTKGYPRKSFSNANGNLLPDGYVSSSAGAPMRDLTNVTRHLLFIKTNTPCVVLYDDFWATTNFTYSQLYHVLENTLTIDTNTARFSYTSTNSNPLRSAVTTYVAHVTGTGSLSMVRMPTNNNGTVSNIFIPGYFGSRETVDPQHSVIWTSTKTSKTNAHFITVIYPTQPGVSGEPVITSINALDGTADQAVEIVSSAGYTNRIYFGAATNCPIAAGAQNVFSIPLNVSSSEAGSGSSTVLARTVFGGGVRIGGWTVQ